MPKGKKIIVIGSGFAGLSAAGALAKQGHNVTILEKNSQPGGRARTWEQQGFLFDMGPSWYWMPEVFENYYRQFGHTTSDFYELKRLDPSYRVFLEKNELIDVPAKVEELVSLFEKKESGSGQRLQAFLADAK
ncbi:MAG TPA: FAD-dependent oxidoreductase, partial [Chitinophagales bacterium]|nr:FAD-dependent oxidoreductase [Chitinophagales bacterium]